MKVGVIGAGPAGLTAARQLAKAGVDVSVFEASPAVGGFSRSLQLWGHTVDVGPHRFFSSDPRVNGFWLDVVGRDYRMVNRHTRILYRGRLFDYPLRVANALGNMGPVRAAACVLSYGRERARNAFSPRDLSTFEDWVIARFGRVLYETFFKTYSEKLWGIPCTQLDADFAAQRIKRFSLGEAIKNMLGIGGKGHKTLVDQFAYPLRGTGMVYERMAEQVSAMGGSVETGCGVERVVARDGRVVGLIDARGREHAFDHVVSTMPLTAMVRSLPDLPERVSAAVSRLRHRNTILVYLLVDGTDLFPDQWLYIHSPEVRMGRITNFRNWIPDICGDATTSVLAAEYWCYDDDPEWRATDEALIAEARREVGIARLAPESRVREGKVLRLQRSYPVYEIGYREHVAVVADHLRGVPGITPIGRYGSFKYNNQDHSILMGLLAAENITRDAGHDLWAVNTDYETYQESSRISESGLVQEPHAA